MNFTELFFIAVGLSMDAFAVAICAGLTMASATVRKSLIIGLYFGIFQAVMPLAGYMFATQFANKITTYDHWIAFTLLCFIGGEMIVGSFKKEESVDMNHLSGDKKDSYNTSPAQMLPLALATSIDALAVGVSFAFLRVNIVPAVSFIGIITLVLSMIGVKIGNISGARFKSKAEIAGGIILILIGLKILIEHLSS